MNRRNFIKTTGAVAAGLSVFGCGAVNKKTGIIMPKGGKRVVVLGGGFGGATAAKYIKLDDPSIDVVLVEKLPQFVSCPVSNWVLAGMRQMSDITFGYDTLAKKYGIKVVQAEAVGLDPENKKLATTAGTIEYDKIIVSPGIEFMYDKIEGLSEDDIDKIPHAYKAGPQTVILRKQLEAMKPGGSFVIATPPKPYRCPPGPYERISVIANYLKKNKPGSKVIVLDPNDGIASKGKLFKAAWDAYYSDVIEYHKLEEIVSVDAGSKTIKTVNLDTDKTTEVKADVLNVIPAMKAGKFANVAGLMGEKDRWVKVNAFTMESQAFKDVHVIGDATHAGTVGPVPKSGYIANSMAKVAASAVVQMLNGKEPLTPTLANTCYSMVNSEEAIFVSAVYGFDKKANLVLKTSGGLSPTRKAIFGKHADNWAKNIWSDMLG